MRDFRPLSVKTREKRKATPPRKGWANANYYYKLNPRKDNRDLSATGTKHGFLLVAVARIRKGHLPVTQSRSDLIKTPFELAGSGCCWDQDADKARSYTVGRFSTAAGVEMRGPGNLEGDTEGPRTTHAPQIDSRFCTSVN
jgi:hypothetical protein